MKLSIAKVKNLKPPINTMLLIWQYDASLKEIKFLREDWVEMKNQIMYWNNAQTKVKDTEYWSRTTVK